MMIACRTIEERMAATDGRSARWVFHGPGYSFRASGFGDDGAVELAENDMRERGLDPSSGHWRKMSDPVRTVHGMAEVFVWVADPVGGVQ